MAVPFEPVVAVWVVVLPLGDMTLNVTLAPKAGVPPLVTTAVRGIVPGLVKLDPGTEILTPSEGGITTVAFAVPDVVSELFAAFMLTAYVPAGVPAGAPLPMATAADWPGPSVTDDVEREVDHPEGSLEPKLIVLEEHPDESLFVTVAE